MCTYFCVIKKGKSAADVQWGLPLQTPQEQSEGLRSVSCLTFYWLHAVITAATQTGSAAPLHDGQMDRKIKNTSRECADTLPNLFQALKIHTDAHRHEHTHTLRMLRFLPSATSESDIFTLAVFCFEYLSLPLRSQTSSGLFCGYMTCEKATSVYTVECYRCHLRPHLSERR